ncbi:MAG: sigma-70 family RNA polymerase sigma factor [Bacteroidota bacterium]
MFDISTEEGYEKLYNKFFEKMHSIAYAKTNSNEIAENLVQEIFLSIWERKNKLVFKESAERYLMRALSSKIIDHYRAKAIRQKHLEAEKLKSSQTLATTEENLEFGELEVRLKLLVNELPEKSQKIFKLSREFGMTNRDISKHLAIPERTISTHLSKTISHLKSHLKGDYSIS